MSIIRCPNCKVKIDTATGKTFYDEKPLKGNQQLKGVEKDEKGRFKSKKEKRAKEEIKGTLKDESIKKEVEENGTAEGGILDFF